MAKKNRQGIRFVLSLGFGLLFSSPLFADGLPTYTATNGFASFSFPGAFGGGMASFSVTGPRIVASGSGGDPASAPQDAPSGTKQFVNLNFGFGYFGSAVAGGTVYDALLYFGFVGVSSNARIIWPRGNATLNLPATSDGQLVACTPSFDCSLGGGMQVFNLGWTVPGHLTVSFADDGTGLGFDFVTNATLTPVPEPSSIGLVLLGTLALMAGVLCRYRMRLSRV